MEKILEKKFYSQEALTLAPLLLGKWLVRKLDNGELIKYRITEVEAYVGEIDTACHAHRGKTERNSIMYENGGYSYVYMCYGIHYLLNIVTGKKCSPEAILIRCVEGYSGPGKLTKALNITKEQNKLDLTNNDCLWLEDDGIIFKYTKDKRVGIEYATKEYRDKLWRFILKKQDV